MKIEYLREFLTLVETLNFSTAAKRMHISQPVLSSHVKSMEAELGFPLFVRDKHSVRLSEIGAEIIPQIQQVLESYDDVLQTANRFIGMRSSALTVGYLYNAFRTMLPPLSSEFSNEYPDTQFHLRSFGYKGVTDALKQGAIDIAFTIDVDESLHDSCNMLKLDEDPICCVVRRDDPLAEYDELSIQDLRGESFLLPHPDDSGNLAFYYDELFRHAGFAPHTSMLYREIDTRYLAIESGEGVALVGRHFEPHMADDVVFIPLAEPYWKYDLCAMWKKSNSNKGIPALMELVTGAFGLGV